MIAVNQAYQRPLAAATKPAPAANPVQLVVFSLGTQVLALPVGQVREVLRFSPITPLPKAPAFVEGVLHLRGRVLPVADLRRRLDLPATERNDHTRIVVLRKRIPLGLIVDAVQEVLTVPAEAIQQLPAQGGGVLRNEYVAGVARTGERLIVLLNVAALFPEE